MRDEHGFAAKDGALATDPRQTTSGMLRICLVRLVWTLAVVAALVLVVGALLVATHVDPDDPVARAVLAAAGHLDLGVFDRFHGLVRFSGQHAVAEDALANWGIGAAAYLVVGAIVERVVRP